MEQEQVAVQLTAGQVQVTINLINIAVKKLGLAAEEGFYIAKILDNQLKEHNRKEQERIILDQYKVSNEQN
jgi:hypothetical protein